MTPPIVWPLTKPRSHRISKITKIVHITPVPLPLTDSKRDGLRLHTLCPYLTSFLLCILNLDLAASLAIVALRNRARYEQQ